MRFTWPAPLWYFSPIKQQFQFFRSDAQMSHPNKAQNPNHNHTPGHSGGPVKPSSVSYFPFCAEISKYEKMAKVGEGTFGWEDTLTHSTFPGTSSKPSQFFKWPIGPYINCGCLPWINLSALAKRLGLAFIHANRLLSPSGISCQTTRQLWH